ncbi:MAG: T9SS type A sorting domain-containing protein [Bacteroidia bacterium]|nr:T9SS type A sorting domain-containing protein [Bacteroidia bacterium]
MKPLNSNPVIQSYLKANPDYRWNATAKHGKWGTPDTLALPFFDDFTSTLMYPDSSNWQDNQVYVNRDFAIRPPSYGVATFDYLDETGKPYSSIESEFVDNGDTLTSQYINLGAPTVPGDSLYLSFFYQPRGRGDFITENDSLKLLFRDNTGAWRRVWGVRGTSNYDFQQVLIPITDARYFHTGFQFRFTTITHRWGNNNHWHVDYVYLDRNRTFDATAYDDLAIQTRPTSLFKDFYSLPYDHFLADQSQAADTFYFRVSNLDTTETNAQVRHIEYSGSDVLVKTLFVDNNVDVEAQESARRRVSKYSFNSLSGDYPITISRRFHTKESGVSDITLFQANDSLEVDNVFTRHYAYDDGTAESGFGFNDLKSDEGWIVVEFDLKKADTLRAVDILITYNTQDVSNQRFDFQIWQDIAFNGGSDVLLYEKDFRVRDIYDSSTNRGFYTIGLDSVIPLPAGKFYVGWHQDREYNLTLGFDKNNGYIANDSQMNTHIYFNIGTGWIQNENKALVGAPMIRPIVGDENPFNVSVENVEAINNPLVYPNPTSGKLFLPYETDHVIVRDMMGKQMSFQRVDDNQIDISNLVAGIYFVEIITKQKQRASAKLIKR